MPEALGRAGGVTWVGMGFCRPLACAVLSAIVPLCVFCLQEAESNRLCRRLQLKDIIPAEMQRLTKYPLLLENIAKYTGTSIGMCLLCGARAINIA